MGLRRRRTAERRGERKDSCPLKPLDDQSLARRRAVCCEVAADAVLRVSLESLPELRRNPGSCVGEPLPVSFLKHADEQTVAGLAAVYRAIRTSASPPQCFRDWGVVAAPRFLGRPTMAAALQRFAVEGAWGVSPHLIPHRSLHSLSGTVSQALKIQGPNFGVGGGAYGVVEALLAATALLERKCLPGVWLVLTCLDPELPPDASGRSAPGTQALGLALALTPPQPNSSRIRLQLVLRSSTTLVPAEQETAFNLLRLETLLQLLHSPRGGDTTIVQLLEGGHRLELSRSIGGAGWRRSSATDAVVGSLALADY
jgi:hypothetical protein